MRHKLTEQIDIFHTMGRNEIAKELKGISDVLDANPAVLEPVYKDLTKTSRSDTGRIGMTAEQVLRSAILKQYRNLTYEELEFHLEDSKSFRCFARWNMRQYPVSSILQDNINTKDGLVEISSGKKIVSPLDSPRYRMTRISSEIHDLTFPLNIKKREAYALGYTPTIEIAKCHIEGCEHCKIPTVMVTFCPQSDSKN